MLSFSARMLRPLCFAALAATATCQGASAACYAPDQQMSPQAVSDFLNNAAGLLSQPENAQGGGTLIDAVRDLVASNPATLSAVIGLLSSANPAQQKAIGTGLGLAANLCSRPDPNFAADISEQLAKTSFDDAKVAYAAIIGKPTGSVAGGGAGGVSGGSVAGSTNPIGGGIGFTSTPAAFTSGGVFNTGTNHFTTSGLGAGSAASSVTTSTTTNTITTTASSSVSK